jgi:CBS domain-containing protein
MSVKDMPPLRIVPDVVEGGATIQALSLDATVEEAAQVMGGCGIGAIAVLDAEGRFAGLVMERDIVRKVVAKGVDARATPLIALLDRPADALAPSDFALDAVDLMRIRNVSHLPVLDGERVTAVVSVADICLALGRALHAQLHTRQVAFFGEQFQE